MRPAGTVPVRSDPSAKAEVRDPAERSRDPVDLLTPSLTHVADVEVSRGAVEREAPRVAQPYSDDLRLRARLVDIKPHELAQERG
jgi:hypothetical protein